MMRNMTDDAKLTRTFQADPDAVGQVRTILESRVRLRFEEGAPCIFVVTGPAWVIDAVAKEIEDANDQAWLDRQW